MSIQTESVEYAHDGEKFEGVVAFDDALSGKRPVVLVCHAWAGRTESEVKFAAKLAELGYIGFAIDLYGKGVVGADKEECQRLMTPFVSDRAMLQSRLLHIVEVAKTLSRVDSRKVAAIGFCFGGLCALDLARSGADIEGVASFHGLFSPPGKKSGKKISAKVIAYHGWDDPMVPPADVTALGEELTAAGADWQILAHGGAMHAFMAEGANDPDFGTVYNEKAARRSWASLENFLKECFA